MIISYNDSFVLPTMNAFGKNVKLMVGQQFSMNYKSPALDLSSSISNNSHFSIKIVFKYRNRIQKWY
ncbi:MAG: hypothetical protein BAJALOKI1v1_300021 [Promethearchaeota archaeon]|nr:MAG: hypothetical protein BAJALOKI1v1_300021 [Candidatus Lokiarchaeota archaeon]